MVKDWSRALSRLEQRIEALEASPETFQRISSLENDVKRLWQQLSEPLPPPPGARSLNEVSGQIRELYDWVALAEMDGFEMRDKVRELFPWLSNNEFEGDDPRTAAGNAGSTVALPEEE